MSENEKETKRKSKKQIISLFLILLVCLMFGVSLADTIETRKKSDLDYERIMGHVEQMVQNGPHSLYDKDANRAVTDYMISQLESYGITEGDTTGRPAYLVQDYVVESDTYQNWYLSNLIVHIPANSAEAMETVQILSEQEGDTLHVRLTDEAAFVYLTFEGATGESFSIDDGENVQTYTFSESGYYYIRLHDNCSVRLKDGTAKVAYREVLRDYEPLIPADYDSEEQLHFNLYLWEEYILSAE